MCHDCDCEAIPVIESLTSDHTAIAARVRRITQYLDQQRLTEIRPVTTELARYLAHHAMTEELGLFAQLRQAGETPQEVATLSFEGERLSRTLGDPDVAMQPDRLRALLAELLHYGEIETEQLYPLARQRLPNEQWGPIEDVHQLMITR
jgi:Hemerythrin HHE cation binding domain